MDFSFVRSFAASLRLNLSTAKKEAKRLQKATPELFGQEYPLNVCQEAIARARGLRHWHEVVTMEQKIGRDRNLPFWHIHARNDYHEKLLTSILQAELESSENGPLVFLGKAEQAIAPALCLWLEEASAGRVPGILLVDTKAQAVQDTALWNAVSNMNLQDLFLQFRALDMRDSCIPVALGTTARNWVRSLLCTLPEADIKQMYDSGMESLLTSAITCYQSAQYGSSNDEARDVSFHIVTKAFHLINREQTYVPNDLRHIADGDLQHLQHSIDKYLPGRPVQVIRKLATVMEYLDQKRFDLGRVIWVESNYRPTIVLFDSDKPETAILASVIYSMYYWKFVGHELRTKGINTRPALYYSDQPHKTIPDFLNQGQGSRSYYVNGLSDEEILDWTEHRQNRAMLVRTNDTSFVYGGKRVPISFLAGT